VRRRYFAACASSPPHSPGKSPGVAITPGTVIFSQIALSSSEIALDAIFDVTQTQEVLGGNATRGGNCAVVATGLDDPLFNPGPAGAARDKRRPL